MYSYIQFSKSRPLIACLIALVYYLVVVLPHERVGKFVEKTLDEPLGRESYNILITSLSLALVLLISIWFIRGLRRENKKTRRWLAFLFTLDILLITLCYHTILVINIELIHIAQYAIMAILVFPILMNYRESLFWAAFLGALDELYQYLILAPEKSDYYDFNDVIINFLGAALGLILVRISGDYEIRKFTPAWLSPARIAIFIICTGIAFGLVTGLVKIYDLDQLSSQDAFIFVKDLEPGFWHELPKSHVFHIIRPIPGFIILFLLFNIFKNIGYKFE